LTTALAAHACTVVIVTSHYRGRHGMQGLLTG